MKHNVSYLLGLKEVIIKGILKPEIINGKHSGEFVQVNAYDNFFERIYDNQMSKLNGKVRNIPLLNEYDEEAILYIINEFKTRFNIDLVV